MTISHMWGLKKKNSVDILLAKHERMLHMFKLSAPFFFGNAMSTPPIFMSFWTLNPNLTSKMSNMKKLTALAIWNFYNYNGDPKTKFDKFYKKWVIRAANDERISNLVSKFKSNNIWPLLAQKWSKTEFCQFSTVSGQKGVKCCLISILRPDLKFSRHLHPIRPLFC